MEAIENRNPAFAGMKESGERRKSAAASLQAGGNPPTGCPLSVSLAPGT
jgi:hypothetical protein